MKESLEYALIAVIGVLVIGSLLGALMDRPIFMSYAYSESMTPTIDKGDLFFLNPIATNPEVGDIIVFKANGRWTVHRVVAITQDGYITKGDANVATDQQSRGIEPIPKENIAGTVVTFGSHVLTIPEIGNYLETGLDNRTKIFLGALLVMVGVIAFSGGSEKRKKHQKFVKVKFKTLYMLAGVFLLITVAMSIFVSWETVPVEYAVTSAGGLREGWYLPGEKFSTEVTVKNNNMYPMLYYVSGKSPITSVSSTDFGLSGGEEKALVVDITAPKSTAVYSTDVRINAYPHVLPSNLMGWLYDYNPMLPVLAILGEVALILWIIYLLSGIGNEDALKIRKRRTSKVRGVSEVFKI